MNNLSVANKPSVAKNHWLTLIRDTLAICPDVEPDSVVDMILDRQAELEQAPLVENNVPFDEYGNYGENNGPLVGWEKYT